ncbi:MAG: hypothetical protein NT023_24720 [Armatimonadetes bacterium]|nr:hypothetical protein [Armatimonadota bacterium]
MIRYRIKLSELNSRIDTAHPTKLTPRGNVRANATDSLAWRKRAKLETLRVRSARTYSQGRFGDFWGDLKEIFYSIQGGKCGYCEMRLRRYIRRNSNAPGEVDGEVDHYRPKDGVKEWTEIPHISTGGRDDDCYYLLAFFPSNYVLSCSACNNAKWNYFPIAPNRCSAHSCKKADLDAELPYLIHPLNSSETDPETLIGFKGIIPIPLASPDTHDYWRAQVTIRLLGLSKGARLKMDEERAEVIRALYVALRLEAAQPGNTDVADELALLPVDALPHRNCARSFVRLYRTNPAKAAELAREAHRVLQDAGLS